MKGAEANSDESRFHQHSSLGWEPPRWKFDREQRREIAQRPRLSRGAVCLRFAGERLVFFRQFEQPRTGLLIDDAGRKGSATSGAH